MEELIDKKVKGRLENGESVKGYVNNVYINGITIHTDKGSVFIKHGKYELIETKQNNKTTD